MLRRSTGIALSMLVQRRPGHAVTASMSSGEPDRVATARWNRRVGLPVRGGVRRRRGRPRALLAAARRRWSAASARVRRERRGAGLDDAAEVQRVEQAPRRLRHGPRRPCPGSGRRSRRPCRRRGRAWSRTRPGRRAARRSPRAGWRGRRRAARRARARAAACSPSVKTPSRIAVASCSTLASKALPARAAAAPRPATAAGRRGRAHPVRDQSPSRPWPASWRARPSDAMHEVLPAAQRTRRPGRR